MVRRITWKFSFGIPKESSRGFSTWLRYCTLRIGNTLPGKRSLIVTSAWIKPGPNADWPFHQMRLHFDEIGLASLVAFAEEPIRQDGDILFTAT
jgi:hypothetical protein